jgi:hypothetical protein
MKIHKSLEVGSILFSSNKPSFVRNVSVAKYTSIVIVSFNCRQMAGSSLNCFGGTDDKIQ